ncbi:polyketide synthase [Candidatus Scalindua japonica]|uniref:Polyketide synthase n=1 Tax=Candidatus Scalindua japonica TaxID=1284222 RepID=A0A286TTC6_9BACT|nr:SDR family NAD(P)-dependent oxidoreductase [Candidatus Scalindua japonica]GAX59140.1 polyketide synthase [Candidatus Scalindua japonica]
MSVNRKRKKREDIAIIGIAGRFPGAASFGTLWQNIRSGTCSVSRIPAGRWNINSYFSRDKEDLFKSYSIHGGFIEGVDLFDAEYFGIGDDRAKYLDPQQRLLLEVVAESINHAGYKAGELSNKNVGVFIGAHKGDYEFDGLFSRLHDEESSSFGKLINSKNGFIGNMPNMIPAMVSDFFNFTGASLAISTACSSSLVSVHMGCKSIINGESDLVVAGGVELILSPKLHISCSKAGMLSTDGRCKTFSENADGFVLAEGVGAVLLKSLKKAEQDGDNVHAVIKSSAVNNDGRTMSVVMPNMLAQEKVIEKALRMGDIDPLTIGYLEVNGSGTLVGDPIEIRAASRAYGKYTDKKSFCAVGSIKTNIGHAGTAAGIASLLKVILSLENKQIPPTLHCDKINQNIKFHETPFYPNTRLKEWRSDNGTRRAGVSSFGFGGTNCHMILEEFVLQEGRYSINRRPLPPIQFNRKRYWIGERADLNDSPVKAKKVDYSLNKNRASIHTHNINQGHKFLHNDTLQRKIEQYIQLNIAGKLSLSVSDIDLQTRFLEMGIDSTVLIALVNQFKTDLDLEISPALLFEYQNIKELAQYFTVCGSENLSAFFGVDIIQKENIYSNQHSNVVEDRSCLSSVNVQKNLPQRDRAHSEKKMKYDEIAIIGIEGRFPESRDTSEFWNNLLEEKNCISLIPRDRWEWEHYFGNPQDEINKTNSKWGGFIEDVDKFDALFFNISPREAELIDPQHRIFLETVWKAIENSGYKVSDFSGTKTGVFVGVSTNDYCELQDRCNQDVNTHTSTGMVHSMLPNRISYLLNLHGPSEAVDTACSSSLVAVHRAVSSILTGECEIAIAGGVNILLTPKLFISFSKAGILSPEGRCKTFDKSADGYVRGEGAGAILLKPLTRAIEDNDYIYGVIKGSAVNHGGHASSLTAPNPDIQADLLVNAYGIAGIDPETVSYIETHGTGTVLGDPVEINGLKKAFNELNKRYNRGSGSKNYCGLGSVKTNIGHLEAAAGIAGVIKVLLSMKHRKIPATINFQELNPYIDISGSPFYIVKNVREWKRLNDEKGTPVPRRAGVSSFGFGGANAHIVLEEFEDRREGVSSDRKLDPEESFIIVLSAKSEDQLKEYTKRLNNYLKPECDKVDNSVEADGSHYIGEIAYTLQTGRDAFNERLALVVNDRKDLVQKLDEYLDGFESMEGLYRGSIKPGKRGDGRIERSKEEREFVLHLFHTRKYSKIAAFWVDGSDIDWEGIYSQKGYRRIPLPTYPFARERYWIENESIMPVSENSALEDNLIPVVDSSFHVPGDVVEFRRQLQKSEAAIKDHIVGGRCILPGVSYLEMAHVAGSISNGNMIHKMRRIVWSAPLIVDDNGSEVSIKIYKSNNNLDYEISSSSRNKPVIHSTGRLVYGQAMANNHNPYVDIEAVKRRCTGKIKKDEIYRFFKTNGIVYGKYFKGLSELYTGNMEAIGCVQIPEVTQDELNKYALHPAILDSAFQSFVGTIQDRESNKAEIILPFSVEEIEVFGSLKNNCYSYVKVIENNPEKGIGRYNIEILDEEGNILVAIRNFCVIRQKSSIVRNERLSKYNKSEIDTQDNDRNTSSVLVREEFHKGSDVFYLPDWREEEVSTLKNVMAVDNKKRGTRGESVLIFNYGEDSGIGDSIAGVHQEQEVINIRPGKKYGKSSEHVYEIDVKEQADYDRLFSAIGYIDTIYFLGGLCSDETEITNAERLDISQERGVLSLFRIVKGIINNNKVNEINQLKVITNNLQHVNRSDASLIPYAGSLVGLARVISRELPTLSICSVDINKEEVNVGGNGPRDTDWVKNIFEQIKKENGSVPFLEIALRQNRRYVKGIKAIKLFSKGRKSLPLRMKGVYLIIGGAGGIGFAISKYLSTEVQARLILVGRRDLGQVENSRLNEIKETGGEVLYLKGDVTKIEDMHQVIKEGKSRFGKINGVIHSAIVLRDNLLSRQDEVAFRDALDPKVKGCFVLNEVTKNEPMDFLVFFSSLNSMYGNSGQGSYVAGCAFEDAFGLYLKTVKERPVKIINWGYWGDVGIVSKDGYRKILEKQGIYALSKSDGIEMFKKAMASRKLQLLAIKADNNLLKELKLNTDKILCEYEERQRSNVTEIIEHVNMIRTGDSLNVNGSLDDCGGLEEIEEFGRVLLLKVFQEIGILKNKDELYDLNELSKRLGIANKYTELYEALLGILETHKYIERKGHEILVTEKVESRETIKYTRRIEKVKERLMSTYPDMQPHVILIDNCVRNYPSILAGRMDHMEIMFPNGSMEMVEGIYKGNRVSDYFNNLLTKTVESIIKQKLMENGSEEKVKILEVGSGTGGTSAWVFEGVRDYGDNIEYCYTDISVGFVNYGKTKFSEKYPFVRFKELNIEKNIEAQGFEIDEFDIVLASNVFHATRDLKNTLNQAKKLLTTNGILLLNEVTRVQDFLTMTFGLTEGWWLFEDKDVRIANSPLLSPSKWRELLSDMGFRKIEIIDEGNYDNGRIAFNLIIGESNGLAEFDSDPIIDRNGVVEIEEDAASNYHPVMDTVIPDDQLISNTTEYLKDIFVAVLKIRKSQIETNVDFAAYGLDSLVTQEVVSKLEKVFGDLPKTLLFEHMNLKSLAMYFIKNHRKCLNTFFEMDPTGNEKDFKEVQCSEALYKQTYDEDKADISGDESIKIRNDNRASDDAIAIVGLSGRYPLADDTTEYWDNLKKGRNCITEIPGERWDHECLFDTDRNKENKSYSKWGGFVSDYDKFDPVFFNISPREAATMDPHQRLFLEIAWAVLEDSGYIREKLKRDIGVFVGVMSGEYQLYGRGRSLKGDVQYPDSAYWSIANRISYFLDFCGPSLAIDTACSSSLTAIHMACESIRRGECCAAIAGGVNLLVHPDKYIQYSMANVLSHDENCKSFGEGADGFVCGEGVGALFLKPLSYALTDNDQIYGVIKGSFINAGGKTSGYTVPNPNAQTDLISKAIEKAGIDPRTISYVEAHGTGTSLGDPIEITGLKNAFNKYTEDRQYCPIGSVKSNIGHLEAAAGIAGVTKVLMQLKYRQLVPSIHSASLNPKIDFSNSPFFVQRELSDWERPVVTEEEVAKEFPRRASISSFGAGGANAHIIIEEFVKPDQSHASCESGSGDSEIIILSANNSDRLLEYAGKLKRYLEQIIKDTTTEPDVVKINGSHRSWIPCLKDIAYTLQTGREAFDERLAFVVTTKEELVLKLNDYISGKCDVDNLFKGNVKTFRDKITVFDSAGEDKAYVRMIIEGGKIKKIASLWIAGADINWDLLHENKVCRRISLPTYPFERKRYWINPDQQENDKDAGCGIPLKEREMKGPDDSGNSNAGIFNNKIIKEGRGYIREESICEADGSLLIFIQDIIKKGLCKLLYLDSVEIDTERKFIDLGLDSVVAVGLIKYVNKELGLNLKASIIYDYPSIKEISVHLVKDYGEAIGHNLQNGKKELSTYSEKTKVMESNAHSHSSKYSLKNIDSGDRNKPGMSESTQEKKPSVSDRDVSIVNKNRKQNTKKYFQGGKSGRNNDSLRRFIEEKIKKHLCNALYFKEEEIDIERKFIDLGLDSVIAVELIKKVNNELGLNLKASVIYDYPSISEISGYLLESYRDKISNKQECGEENEKKDKGKNILKRLDIHNAPSLETIKSPEMTGLKNISGQYQGLLIEGINSIDSIKISSLKFDDPEENEVQISVRACTVGLADLLCVKGLYPTMPEYPFIPGFEVSGIVVKTGSAVKKFKYGDEVIAATGKFLGGHAEVVNTKEAFTVRKPENTSFEEACSLPVAFITAYCCLHEAGRLREGEKVLIQTAASAVGLIAVQLAKLLQAEIFGTAGSPEKLQYLKEIGVTHVINYREEDFAERIMQITNGYGIDVVLNTLTGESAQKGLDILAPGGRYIDIAVAGLRASRSFDLSNMVNNQTFSSIDLRKGKLEKPEDKLEIMLRMLDDGLIKPVVSRILPFSEINKAYNDIEKRKNIGRVVLSVPARVFQPSDDLIFKKGTETIPQNKKETYSAGNKNRKEIAVIGISGRFAGSDTIDEYWENLLNGLSCITEVSAARWNIDEFYDTDQSKPNKSYSKWAGCVRDIDKFEPSFFEISRKEAELLDPQQRIFLEETWNALEDAAYSDSMLSNRKCGVFVGVGGSEYEKMLKREGMQPDAYTLTGNTSSILTSRIAYILNLKGPSIAIDTACSSSLVAIHLACESIIRGECDMALAGGVYVMVMPDMHIMMSKAGMLSPDGRCKTFDNSADGFVPGEGVGVVVLKLLEKAKADGDHIYGVIKGSGINQDGSTNGITAPNTHSQTELELEIYRKSGINPETIGYVEAHGTGTKLGDPIEIEALKKAFSEYTGKKQYCGIGSVKPNIGHTLTAAGVASVLKVLLSLKHKKLPPTIHFNEENDHIDFADSPFYVNDKVREWKAIDGIPRRAAVSSFGYSGTNCHMVIEESPVVESHITESMPYYLITISARTENSLNKKLKDLKGWVKTTGKNCDLRDISYTLNAGRSHFSERTAFVVKDIGDMVGKIEAVMANGNSEDCYKGSKNGKSDYIDSRNQESTYRLIEELQGIESNSDAYKENLSKLANLFIQGLDIDWYAFYRGSKCNRISLPTYPFMRERFWAENVHDPAEQLTKDSEVDAKQSSSRLESNREDLMAILKKLEEKSISADDADRLTFVRAQKGTSPYA